MPDDKTEVSYLLEATDDKQVFLLTIVCKESLNHLDFAQCLRSFAKDIEDMPDIFNKMQVVDKVIQ